MSEVLRLRRTGLGWEALDNEVVALDSVHGVYFSANESGALLWEALSRGATMDELVQMLVDEYGIEPPAASRDAKNFVDLVRDQQLLENDEVDVRHAGAPEPT